MSLSKLIRLIGPVVLLVLLFQVDFEMLAATVIHANGFLVSIAVLLNLPMVACKTLRWQTLLAAQNIHYGIFQAYMAYFGSIFLGLLTPGKIGEWGKAVHVSRDCNVALAPATASVLVDRGYDLVLLLLFGCAGLLTLAPASTALLGLGMLIIILLLVLLLHSTSFLGNKKIAEVRARIQMPLGSALGAGIFTLLAYSVFFGQCHLLALALALPISPLQVMYAVSLGSLIALLPISIAGLGTREAAIIAYLVGVGVAEAQAFGFALLIFETFHLGGAFFGAAAWYIKPIPTNRAP